VPRSTAEQRGRGVRGARARRCAVFASQAISSNEHGDRKEAACLVNCVALPPNGKIWIPVSRCIRRGTGVDERATCIRPALRNPRMRACLSEVLMRDRRGHPV